MGRRTFISYKYSEAQHVRDSIIEALGDDATYYKGETAESPDLTDTSTENIKNNLKTMMHGTSVTIVVISPNLNASQWIDWEISYSLKEITRKDRTSRSNGIVGVVMKYAGDYDWLFSESIKEDGCSVRTVNDGYLYNIINNNRYNVQGGADACEHCNTYSSLNGSYIALVTEEAFLESPETYIENAYDKCQSIGNYKISKQM